MQPQNVCFLFFSLIISNNFHANKMYFAFIHVKREQQGGAVVSAVASQHEGPEFELGLSMQGLHVLLRSACIYSGCSGFLSQSNDMQLRNN